MEWKIDDFDSMLLGLRSAKVWMTPGEPMAAVDSTLEEIGHAFVACFVPFDRTILDGLQDRGFRLISVRATLHRDGPFAAGPGAAAGAASVVLRRSDLRRLDEGSFDAFATVIGASSRYFKDGLIPRDRSLALYRTWICNSVFGDLVDEVFCTTVDGELAAFHSVKVRSGVGIVDLLGVLPRYQGIGLGAAVLEIGLEHLGSCGAGSVEVVTEAENIAAMRTYERAGFLLKDVQFVMHRHTEEPTAVTDS